MTENTGSFSPQYPEYPAQQAPPAEPSATELARHQAANVGRSAADAGSQVAQTATDQARVVASETARHTWDLLGEAGGQARDQASVQQRNAARQVRSFADELQEMAAKGGQSGLATEVAQQAAERLHGTASWLEQREPADVLQAVKDFARRRPGTFILGAAVAGLMAGRLTRGLTDAARHQGGDGQQRTYRDTPTATPSVPSPDWAAPAYDNIPGGITTTAYTSSDTPTTANTPVVGTATAGPDLTRAPGPSTGAAAGSAIGPTAGSESYSPVGGVPSADAPGPDEESAARRVYEDLPDTDPAVYRRGQQP